MIVVLIGGTNFVAVRFSNRELPPFWGAGLRFAIAGALLVGFAGWRRIPLPLGSTFPGVAFFGVLNFGMSYALAYWGLLEAPAAMAATFVALVPLMTFFMATALGMSVSAYVASSAAPSPWPASQSCSSTSSARPFRRQRSRHSFFKPWLSRARPCS